MADDADDFVVYGTRLKDEEESRGNQRHKHVTDPAATRALPLHKQEVTDEQGRRRFHGAFTGGFSAGYYNTVGSKEGWTPSTFRSSRGDRADVRQQTVSDFLDADELQEAATGALKNTRTYDTFGVDAAAAARAALAEAAGARASGIGGLVPEELLTPVQSSIGMQLLQKMGWRPGRGVAHDPASLLEGGAHGGRWGAVAGVGPDNTPLYLLQPKKDLHGLGYDPFKGAAEFREARKRAREGAGDQQGPRRKQRGVAFGTGALDEDDSMGIMADYVDYVDDIRRAGGKSRGDFHFELQSSDQFKRPGALIPNFILAVGHVSIAFFAPPAVPRGYDGRHAAALPPPPSATKTTVVGMAPLPPKVEPPKDPALRGAIERLAVFVFRNGPVYEATARATHQRDALYAFLFGGSGAEYYAYRLAFFKALSAPPVVKREAQRAAPLTADERGQMLGETPLPQHAAPSAAEAMPPPADRRVPLMKIADADRQRIRQALGGSFVRAEDRDAAGGSATTVQPGLRPGAPPKVPQAAADAAAAFLASMSDRFASGGTVQAATQEGLQQPPPPPVKAPASGGVQRPVRHVEPWRPVPLLCKRLNVADPYKGKAAEVEMSKFKTDYLALPETVAAANEAAKAAFDALEQQSLPPPPPRAPEKKGGTAQSQQPQQLGEASSATAQADDFLGAALGNHTTTEAAKAGPAAVQAGGTLEQGPPEQGALEEVPEVEDERPIDIFKAIFEDDDSSDEDKGGEVEEAPAEGEKIRGGAAGSAAPALATSAVMGAEATQPVATQPVTTQPVATLPVTTQPVQGEVRQAPAETASAPPVQTTQPDAAVQRQKLLDALELLRRAKKDGKKKKKSSKSKKKKKKLSSKKSKKERRESSDEDSSSDD